MRGSAVWVTWLCVGVFAASPPAAMATEPQDNGPIQVAAGPRFLTMTRSPSKTGAKQWVDASRLPVFQRQIAVDLRSVPLGTALLDVARKAGLQITYSPNVVQAEKAVTLTAATITVGAALGALLYDAGVDVLLTGSQVVVVRQGQTPVVTGVLAGHITDVKTGAGVAGAEVLLEKTRWRATTDTGGYYRIADIDTGSYTLTVRRLGYAKQSRPVHVRDNQADTADVILEPVVARLQELVSTATGRQRRLDIANDVTVLNADSIMQTAPITSVTDLLATRVPGLTVQRTSGAPGDPSRLRLRGVSSPLRNNDPIVIVDGVRVYAEQSAARSGNLASFVGGVSHAIDTSTNAYATPSPLDYIDPNTIETIEVLKGPSAATLYGQDAANGVIVITTKRGKAGPSQWTASAEFGRTQMEGEYPQLLFRWGHESFGGAATYCPISNMYGGIPCDGDSLRSFQILSDPNLTVLDRGNRTALTLGVSGGTAALTYAVTGSYQDELGLVKLPTYEADRFQSMLGIAPPDWMRRPQHLKQWGATSTIGFRLGAKADVALVASLSRTEQQRSSLERQLGELMSTYLDQASGTYYQRSGGNDGSLTTLTNALDNYYERATANATAFTNSANVNWRPRGWLTVSADAGLNVEQRSDGLFFPRGPTNFAYGGFAGDTTGYVNDGQGTAVVSTLNLRANALAPLGRGFQFRFAAGANYTGTSTNDVSGGSRNLAPGSSLQGGITAFLRRSETSDATFGWYLEPSVGNSKFNFSSGLRLDGGSSYGSAVSGLQLPKFPKLGFSYLVSDERWFPFKDLFQSLRLRVSYGRASRQPGPTDRLRLYNSPAQEFADSLLLTSVTLQTLGNTEIRPERSSEFEGGFDADLLDNRVTLTVSGYRKTTDDALLSIPVAPSVYGSNVSIIRNIGITRNTGLELDIGAQIVRSGPVTFGTQLQVSQNRNVVVELGPDTPPFYTSGNNFAGGVRVAAGYPLFGRWSRPILGYADANGNGVLEPQEVQIGDTAVYTGSTLPNYTASLHTTVTLWHGAVTLDVGFAYDDGVAQRNEVARQLSAFSPGQQDTSASLAEQIAMMDLTISQGLATPNGFLYTTDYNWIQTVNTLRFNSFALSYAVPATFARRLGAQTLRVAIQGSNLGLWTNYRGLDPGVNAFGTGNNVTDTGVLPQPRLWQVRVSASY